MVTIAALSTAFVLVFSIFVVATIVLLILTVRFIVRRGKADKAKWLAEQAAAPGERRNDL